MKKDNLKILICVPRSEDGGLANYYNSLKDLFTLNIEYFNRGKPNWPDSKGFFHEAFRLISDYVSFIFVLLKGKHNIVHINTFFGGLGLYRDLLFLMLSKILRRKVVFSFHGWDYENVKDFDKKLLGLLKTILFKSDALITLSNKEKVILQKWGYQKNVYLETTTVDYKYINDINPKYITTKYDNIGVVKLLFLSRVEHTKGIYEALEAYHSLQKNNYNIRFIIAGKGSDFENVKKYVEERKINNIEFSGFVQGKKKKMLFESSHIFIFPSYSEGMPCAVLEAFAFGLPVIATPVGGLFDIFKDKENGFFVKMKDSEDIKEKTSLLIANPNLMKKIALHNHQYAKDNFASNVVVKRLENIYKEIN